MYQEAFLTTYRTFLTPEELIDKLLYRYNKFTHVKDVAKKRLSRNAFSLLVRVVDELTYVALKLILFSFQTMFDFVVEHPVIWLNYKLPIFTLTSILCRS